MRTGGEILERINSIDTPIFGEFELEVLAEFLPWEQGKTIAKEGVTEESWNETVLPLTEEAVIEQMRNYMEFAWGQALDHRGLSAQRSIVKFGAWLWLLDDSLAREIDKGENYPMYGAPALKLICEAYDFPVPEREGAERMMMGLPCRDGCVDGCGL